MQTNLRINLNDTYDVDIFIKVWQKKSLKSILNFISSQDYFSKSKKNFNQESECVL